MCSQCAKRGRPSGGKRDTIPPVILKSTPENFSTYFDSDEIRIYFDEYIKLKDLQQNLIISPPLKYTPIITPLNTSKILKIKILDTLKENTTYQFNFGKSIVDNNEDNEFEYFKYVFSTGSYIDSLSVSGSIQDAVLLNPASKAAVMLYEVNEAFKDSIVYSEKPTYVATSRDSTFAFELTNLKAGTYLMLALQEENNDFTFQPKNDQIGFIDNYVTVPSDSSYAITMFKEVPDYKPGRPGQRSKNRISFGYEGEPESFVPELISEVPSDFEVRTFKDRDTDTLNYWYKPALEVDSLLFRVASGDRVDTLNVRIRELYPDSLQFTPIKTGNIIPNDTVRFAANIPLESLDAEKITVVDQDTLDITSTATINKKDNTVGVYFEKTENNAYKVNVLPGALTDFLGAAHDSLVFSARTRSTSDYGTITLNLVNNRPSPVIVQLVDIRFNVIAEQKFVRGTPVYFEYVPPEKYYIRFIVDENDNGRWDTGNFLQRQQPEEIIYFPTQLQVNVNWDLVENFTLN